LSIKLDYYTNYYSGRLSTYKLDQTIVTVGAPRILAIVGAEYGPDTNQ
jgi:hypothetical protein